MWPVPFFGKDGVRGKLRRGFRSDAPDSNLCPSFCSISETGSGGISENNSSLPMDDRNGFFSHSCRKHVMQLFYIVGGLSGSCAMDSLDGVGRRFFLDYTVGNECQSFLVRQEYLEEACSLFLVPWLSLFSAMVFPCFGGTHGPDCHGSIL